MNKPKLSDFNISDYQYSKYKEYIKKCEIRESKIKNIDNILFYFIIIVVYIFFVAFIAKSYSINFTKVPAFIKNGNEIINLIILAITIIIYSLIVLFPLGGLLSVVIYGILSLLKIPKLTMYIYSICYKHPQKDSYFDKIEIFEKKITEYEDHISILERDYPDISNYNFDKQLYFKNIFDNILEYEMKYINNIINQNNLKKEAEHWLGLDGFAFEREVSDLYRKLGYKVETTRAVADGGVDIKLWNKNGEYIIVQCKNHKNKVGPSVVRDLYGTMLKEKADKAILLCSGGFNKGVFDFVDDLPIELMDIYQLIYLAETIYPPINKIGNITNISCLNGDRNFLLKNIENIFILYSHHVKSIEQNGQKYFSNPKGNEFCIFETLDEINKVIEIIKKQVNKPIQTSCIYDIAEWKIQDKMHSYSQKTLYYLRIFREGQDSFKSRKTSKYKSIVKQNIRKNKKWRGWKY